MAEPQTTLGTDDLRAAVASGAITEAQAAIVVGIAQARLAGRAAMAQEDEPFEFFRGFAEIFITVGLVILLSGILSLMALVGVASGLFTIVPAGLAALSWWMAGYFTLRRRMVLPSIILLLAFGAGVGGVVLGLLTQQDFPNPVRMVQWVAVSGAVAMAVWYWRFRLPVAMFFLGLSLLVLLYATWASPADVGAFMQNGSLDGLFDLRDATGLAIATLVFGVGAFAVAMTYDLRDPHRLGRHAATGFWLHLLAATALVNTVALTLYNVGGALGIVLLATALTVIALLALVIDRRSFLTAGLIYIALVLSWIVKGEDGDFRNWTMILILLGALVTALGTWWVPLRSALMRALPGFPGKDRLPPYAETP